LKKRETKNKQTTFADQYLDDDEETEGLLPEGFGSDLQRVKEMLEEAICSGQEQVCSLLCTALKCVPLCWELYDQGRLLEHSRNLRRQSKSWTQQAKMKVLADGPQRKKELRMRCFVAEKVRDYRSQNPKGRR